jgi:hypothetical protein
MNLARFKFPDKIHKTFLHSVLTDQAWGILHIPQFFVGILLSPAQADPLHDPLRPISFSAPLV